MRNDSSKRARTQTTKIAGFIGSYVFSPRDSNVDPVGILMRKQPSGVFELKMNDVLKVMHKHKMSSCSVKSYISSVLQIPKARYLSNGIYEDAMNADRLILESFLSDTELSRLEIEDFERIKWYDNSWIGHSWANSLKSKEPAPPCFWTKTFENFNDPISQAWIEYEKKYPGRGWRISYEKYTSLNEVYMKLLDFLDEYPSGEVHVWIQGNLKGMGPAKTLENLREKIRTEADMRRSGNEQVEESFQLQYYDGDEVLLKPNSPYYMMEEDYTPFTDRNMWYEFLRADIMLFMSERPSAVVISTVPHDFIETYPNIVDGVIQIPGTPINRSMEARRARGIMEKHSISLYSSFDEITEPGFYLTLHDKEKLQFIYDYESSGVARVHRHIHNYWTSDLYDSYDPYFKYVGSNLQRIPVIPWRVTNYGHRLFGDGLLPQLFPCTQMGLSMTTMDTKTRYLNYTGNVKFRKPFSGEKFDFVWVGDNMNGYRMEKQEVAMDDGLVVGNPEIFLGMGSVVVSVHSIMKFKRDELSKLKQVAREIAGHEKVSGHMFAAVLAYQSHLIWYLYEVFKNAQTKRSIYLFDFRAEKTNRYHTTGEYTATLHDIETYLRTEPAPSYINDNVAVCREVVSMLQT
jgi:hypothetical protein